MGFKEAIDQFLGRGPKQIVYIRGFPGEDDNGFTRKMAEQLTPEEGFKLNIIAGDPKGIIEHLEGKNPGEKAILDGVEVTRV